MAERFKEADERIFKDVYICRKCNARNKVHDPEDAKCRKCGYDGLRPKNKEFASE
ncbi:MAG: 50S ribosomal protein L40e [Candidatus Nanohaloarchaeota archaeon QJJ-9]|nr:50S ribosomal protein L40e [Candidatus Nanohaloarchaeota archaeon QJJ-9]